MKLPLGEGLRLQIPRRRRNVTGTIRERPSKHPKNVILRWLHPPVLLLVSSRKLLVPLLALPNPALLLCTPHGHCAIGWCQNSDLQHPPSWALWQYPLCCQHPPLLPRSRKQSCISGRLLQCFQFVRLHPICSFWLAGAEYYSPAELMRTAKRACLEELIKIHGE